MRTSDFPNLGAEQLAAAGSISEIAKRLGKPDRTIAGWRAGRIPNGQSAELMKRELAIEPSAWTRAASKTAEPLRATSEDPREVSHNAPAEILTALPRQSAEERLREQMRRLWAQREAPGLSERARLELEKLELQASARLARLEGATGLSMQQVRASPHTQRLIDTVLGALAPWPYVLGIVADAVRVFDDAPPDPDDFVRGVESDHATEVATLKAANSALVAAMIARRDRRSAA